MRSEKILFQYSRKVRRTGSGAAEKGVRAGDRNDLPAPRSRADRRRARRGPLHGPILKENLEYYIGKYMTWSSYEPEDKGILIAYASIHGNTAKAAKKLKEILESKGAEKVAITDLARDDMAEAIEDAFRYDRMILAAASYDAGVFPCMEDFLHHLKSKAYQKRTVGLLENGSWAPSAARTMKAVVEQMKNVSIVEPVVTIKSTMKDSDIENMEKLADAIINA